MTMNMCSRVCAMHKCAFHQRKYDSWDAVREERIWFAPQSLGGNGTADHHEMKKTQKG